MDWNTVASIATAAGVGIAAWQIWEARKMAQSSFEDSFDQQYRALTIDIPVDALIGRPIDDDRMNSVRERIYNYLDLCNEQIFLRSKRRVRYSRWLDWCDGIKENLGKPAFSAVWVEIRTASPESFTFLGELERRGFSGDPAKWS